VSTTRPEAPARIVTPPVSVTRPAETRPSIAPERTRPSIAVAPRSPAPAGEANRPSAGGGASPARTATLIRPSAETRTPASRFDRDALSRLPSASDRAAATRLSAPDDRTSVHSAVRGTAALRHGAPEDAPTRNAVPDRLAYATSLRRPSRTPADLRPDSPLSNRLAAPERVKPAIGFRPSSSRYPDGRYTVYNPPDRHGGRHTAYRAPHFDRHGHHRPDRHHHHSRFYFGLALGSAWYTPGWYGPSWYAPVYSPASFTSFGWSNRHWGFSFSSYWPVHATPYYDTWTCGGWSYTGIYSGGWRSGWYGGFSYIYNPWPVYRSYYFYDPVPVVTRTETVYVTQPAAQTTVVYEPTSYATASAAPAQQAETATLWDAAPAAEQVEAETAGCFCPCRCNGQRACLCAYPCGAEYAMLAEDFDLSTAYRSYAETLEPETIWESYAGLDRWTQPAETLYAEAAFSAP
jgi:hypothetical protein